MNDELKKLIMRAENKDQQVQIGILAAISNLKIPRRERIAIAAMQGLSSNPDIYQYEEKIVQWAVKQADALIAELDKEETEP